MFNLDDVSMEVLRALITVLQRTTREESPGRAFEAMCACVMAGESWQDAMDTATSTDFSPFFETSSFPLLPATSNPPAKGFHIVDPPAPAVQSCVMSEQAIDRIRADIAALRAMYERRFADPGLSGIIFRLECVRDMSCPDQANPTFDAERAHGILCRCIDDLQVFYDTFTSILAQAHSTSTTEASHA